MKTKILIALVGVFFWGLATGYIWCCYHWEKSDVEWRIIVNTQRETISLQGNLIVKLMEDLRNVYENKGDGKLDVTDLIDRSDSGLSPMFFCQ